MLSDNDPGATVAVENFESAWNFDEPALGVTKIMDDEEVLAFKSGRSTLFICRSPYAATSKAAEIREAEEVGYLVKALKSRGLL